MGGGKLRPLQKHLVRRRWKVGPIITEYWRTIPKTGVILKPHHLLSRKLKVDPKIAGGLSTKACGRLDGRMGPL